MWGITKPQATNSVLAMIAHIGKRQKFILSLNDPILNNFSDEIFLNGERLMGCRKALQYLSQLSDYISLISSKYNSLVHGDLHTGNIMFDSNNEFRLLDPRGTFPNGDIFFDIAYDVAKLLQDLHAKFPVVRHTEFELDISNDREYSIHLYKNAAWNSFDALFRWYCNWCGNRRSGDDLWSCAFLFESLMLCGIVPFQYRIPSVAVTLYLEGVVLLNRWIQCAEGRIPLKALFLP